jgi:hypothetical protein
MQINKENWVNWHEFMPKEDADNFDFGSAAVVYKLAFLLGKQALIMERIPISLGQNRLDLSRPLLLGISSNAQAIIKLAKDNFGNEVYPIARSLIERIITFYYLQSCDQSELDNYIDYSKQKTYRQFIKTITINDKTFKIALAKDIDLYKFPELKNAVDKFTSVKKKKPITRWSNISLEDKLAAIDSVGEANIKLLMITLLSIYDDGSEALHGTLYGCTFHLGAFKPGKLIKHPDDMSKKHRDNLTMIFFLFGHLLGDLNYYVAEKSGLKDLLELSKDINTQIKDTIDCCLKKT